MDQTTKSKLTYKRVPGTNHIYNQQTGLVLHSKEKALVIGRYINGQLTNIDELTLELCDEYGLKPDEEELARQQEENDAEENDAEENENDGDADQDDGEDENDGDVDEIDESDNVVNNRSENTASANNVHKISQLPEIVDFNIFFITQQITTKFTELEACNKKLSQELEDVKQKYSNLQAKLKSLIS